MSKRCKFVKGYDNFYKVTDDGVVWTCRVPGGQTFDRRGEWRKLTINSSGKYLRVSLTLNGIRKVVPVHKVVLETFVGECPKGMQCRHLDGDKYNNHVSNLCWGTPRQNIHDKIDHGTIARGEKINTCKLSKEQVLEIRRLYNSGEYTHKEKLGRMFGVTGVQIGSIVSYNSWKHVA